MIKHPPKGSQIKADPIRSIKDIERVIAFLRPNARNHAIFVLGINSNLRASDIVGLNVGHVAHLQIGDVLNNKDKKVKRYVLRSVNEVTYNAIQRWLIEHPDPFDMDSPLFIGQRGRLTVPTLINMVKQWCAAAGVTGGKFSSHTLRKTWAYHALNTFKVPVHLVSAALGHRSLETTMTYLGIQPPEIQAIFMNELGG